MELPRELQPRPFTLADGHARALALATPPMIDTEGLFVLRVEDGSVEVETCARLPHLVTACCCLLLILAERAAEEGEGALSRQARLAYAAMGRDGTLDMDSVPVRPDQP